MTDDPLKRRESPLLGVYATTTLRKGRGGSSPPSDTTNTQVTAFSDPENPPFGGTVVARGRIGAGRDLWN